MKQKRSTLPTQERVLREFRQIPGVGRSIAQDLWRLGLRSASALKDHDPEKLYEKFCRLEGRRVDRCLLYAFRCAVYFASHTRHNPALLLWWNWKDSPRMM